ncbi:MAG TPA: hypothetical protein VKK31_12795 [Thermoanaerobaculia bacterium]|nr:hypothetical protein [Thermoanaerobaculia bacterium]
MRLRERGEPLTVLDARGRAAFARGAERVAGDVRAEGSKELSWAGALPREGWLLAYCTCLGDGLAVRVATRLREAGFPRACAVAEGLEGCRAAGLPVVPK